MKYEEAAAVGAARCAAATGILEASSGLKAQAVCAVRPPEKPDQVPAGGWQPVGRESFVEVAVFPNKGDENALLGVVDDKGVFKACLREFLPLKEALNLWKQVRLPVAMHKGSTLRRLLEEQDLTEQVRNSTLRIDM